MIGKYTEQTKIIKDNLKGLNFITKDGEVVEIHDGVLEDLAMDVVNYAEQLNGKGSINIVNEKIKEILEKKESQTECQKELVENYGNFYFNFYKRFELDRQFLFRFIFLCSLMNYDNYLSNGERLLTEVDIKSLLNLSEREYYRTKKYLMDKKLIDFTNKGFTVVNSKFCKKGDIHKTKTIEVIRMFNNAIQELYNKSLPREHKKLSLLINILPYINYKYNIICKNPTEDNIELIQPIKMSELCEILGYDKTNSSKLKRQLFNLRVSEEEVIGIFEKSCGKAIFVNPRIYYKGGKLNDVKFLEDIFKVSV